MHNLLLKVLLVFIVSLTISNITVAQSNNLKSNLKKTASALSEKLGKIVLNDKWDSAKYYMKMMDSASKNSYGEICLPNTMLYSHTPLNQTNNYKSAYYYLKRAVEISSKLNDTLQIAPLHKVYEPVIFYFGMLCHFIGANTEAEKYLMKASDIYLMKKRTDRYAQCILVLSGIYIDKGEYAKATLLNITASDALEKIHKSPFEYYLLASGYNNQAIIYAQTANSSKALAYMKKANETEKSAEGFKGNEYIKILLNFSEVYALNGYMDSALQKCKQAEDLLPAKKNNLLKAEILKEKALIYIQQQKNQQALLLLREYKNITDTLSVRLETYDATLLNLGFLYAKTGQPAAADFIFTQEVEKLRQSGLQYSYVMQQSLLGLCINLIKQKKYIIAMDSLISLCHLTFNAISKNLYGMSEIEKLKYKSGLDEIFNLLYESIYKEKIISKDIITETCKLELQRNSLILLSEVNLLSSIRNSSDTALSALNNTWLINKEILSKQYSLAVDERIFNTDSLEDICEALEKKVSLREYGQTIRDYSTNISELFPDQEGNSANIEFVRFHYKTLVGSDSVLYAAFIMKKGDTNPAFVPLCSEAQILKIMKNKNGDLIDIDQLTKKLYSDQSKGADEIYNLIWKPVAAYLTGIENINYSTAGLLNNIAFHALYDGKNYLVKQFTFHRFFSMIDNQNTGYQKPQSVSFWCNMNYDSAVYDGSPEQQNEENPGTTVLNLNQHVIKTKELKNIFRPTLLPFDTTGIEMLNKVFSDDSLSVNSYMHEYATEENFKGQAASITDVLHISTHGFYTSLDKTKSKASLPGSFISGIDNPLFRCWLAFSGANYYMLNGVSRNTRDNGILTGYEVAQLDLHHVQLLILSACETGLGDVTDNEGNMGLQRAFKIAGVNNILMSLWQVPAQQTAELLSLFYKSWLSGQTLSKSLQDAESEMQKKGYASYYWAGFVLIE